MATKQDVVDALVEKTEKREFVWKSKVDAWDSPWIGDCYFRLKFDGQLRVTLKNVGSPTMIEADHTAKLRETIERVHDEYEPSDDEKLNRILACLSD